MGGGGSKEDIGEMKKTQNSKLSSMTKNWKYLMWNWDLRQGNVVFFMLFNIRLERMVRELLDTNERIEFQN